MDEIRRTSGEVLDLVDARLTTKSPILQEAWRYWSSLRTDGAVPRREALDPRAMSLILGHSLILDRMRPGTVRVRTGGRVANDLMGMETRGLPIRAFFDLMQRTRAIALVERAFTEVATLEMDLVSDGLDGPLPARMILLPLRDRVDEVSKALAVLVPERLDAEGPRRFAIRRHHLAPLFAARPIPTTQLAMAAEMQAPFEAAPFLRVVK